MSSVTHLSRKKKQEEKQLLVAQHSTLKETATTQP
jgi:hypothetical protein